MFNLAPDLDATGGAEADRAESEARHGGGNEALLLWVRQYEDVLNQYEGKTARVETAQCKKAQRKCRGKQCWTTAVGIEPLLALQRWTHLARWRRQWARSHCRSQ